MAIPNGYRLLTSDDVGKTFGTDLESIAYFDTSVILTGAESYFATDVEIPLIDGLLNTYGGSNANILLNNYGVSELVWEASSGWRISNIDMGTSVNTVGNFNDSITENWNNWLYVRDIGWVEPYNIISSKPKITINCKGKFMTKDLKIIRELWDGSYEDINDGGSN